MFHLPPLRRLPRQSGWIALLFIIAGTATANALPLEPTYTAQRKPRVAVMDFVDTNAVATSAQYGPSVSAMLVTYLKRHSQFIVVERQELKNVLLEWERNQGGLTNLTTQQAHAELLEKIDVILQGKVTVLQGQTSGAKVEIDAKLLSVVDGRIVTAVQRSGPEFCLRQIVNRLGAVLERDFLRPYCGKLRIILEEPANTHFFLTPVLRDDALDEEKPPVELGSTVYPDEERDSVRQWVTQPTSYTIEHILSGWYTLRLARPGYVDLRIDNSRFRAVEAKSGFHLLYRDDRDRWVQVDRVRDKPTWKEFLVYVEPLTSKVSEPALELRKKQGAISLVALAVTGVPLREGRVLIRSLDLEINPESPDVAFYPTTTQSEDQVGRDDGGVRSLNVASKDTPHQTAARESSVTPAEEILEAGDRPSTRIFGGTETPETRCDFVSVEGVSYVEYLGQVVRTSDDFDLESFKGGPLAFEDYRGQPLPTGQYEVVLWSPNFSPVRRIVNLENGDGQGRPREVRLQRNVRPVLVQGKTDRPVRFLGRTTGHRTEAVLASGSREILLPIDRYQVTADLTDAGAWQHTLDLFPERWEFPRLDQVFPGENVDFGWSLRSWGRAELKVKDGVWVGGRRTFEGLGDVFFDPEVARLLDSVLNNARPRLGNQGEEASLDALTNRLEDIDLLILDEDDLQRLRVLPEVTTAIREWVRNGHALLAFVTEVGDYTEILGAPLIVRKSKRSRKLVLHPGSTDGVGLDKKLKVKLAGKRSLAHLGKKQQALGWRILGYRKKAKKPCLLEHGDPAAGGYTMVWLEDSEIQPRSTPAKKADGLLEEVWEWTKGVRQARDQRELQTLKSNIKTRVLDWAEYLLYRRLNSDGEQLAEAERRILPRGTDAGSR